MKTITFYSYKGGVGRSLALSQVAIRLSEYGKKVCVLDFDLEAPGLHFKFHKYDRASPISKGIVNYIDEFITKGKIPASIKDFSIQLKPKNQRYKNIDLIPAGEIEQDDYWMKLSQIDWSSLFYDEKSLGVKFFLDLKARINKELKPDFLLIDSRTGITDIAGITLRLLADEAVILAANNEENMFGSKKIIKSLIDPDKTLFGTVPKIHFVLTRLPFTDEPREQVKERNIVVRRRNELLQHLKVDTIDISVIHSDRRLEENERHLMGYEKEAKAVSISNDYLDLFEKLSADVLSKKERKEFANKRSAEKEYNSAALTEDVLKKINHLNNAIRLDASKSEFYFERGFAYWKSDNTKQALSDFLTSLKLSPNNGYTLNNIGALQERKKKGTGISYYNRAIESDSEHITPYLNLAFYYQENKKYDKALSILNKAFEYVNTSVDKANLLNLRANIYRNTKKYDKALLDISLAIELNSDNPVFFGTLAEIYADKGMISEFYMNLSVALSKGMTEADMLTAKDVYLKFKDEQRFIELLNKYGIEIEEIIGVDNRNETD